MVSFFPFDSIKHFGGPVTYNAEDFISRNLDALDKDLSRAMFECEHPLLKVFFPEGERETSSSVNWKAVVPK